MTKQITLINPKTKAEYTTTSAVEANDLIYGQGYQLKPEPPVEEAPKVVRTRRSPADAAALVDKLSGDGAGEPKVTKK